MWRRVWGFTCWTTVAGLALVACGKSERGQPDETGNAGSPTGGVTTAMSGASGASGAGSVASAGGGHASTGGVTARGGTSSGGDASGGNAPLGGAGHASGGVTSSGGEAGVSGTPSCGSYQACGCGCCAGVPVDSRCFYPSLGEDLQQIIEEDVARRHDASGCANVGCSRGQAYVCCEAPPPNDDGAAYEATAIVGGYDRIRLNKTAGTECSTFSLVSPKTAGTEFPVELPASWAVEGVTSLRCSSSMTQNQAIGAVGTLSLRVDGAACVLDAHLAAFFGNATDGVSAERFDVEGLPINISASECH